MRQAAQAVKIEKVAIGTHARGERRDNMNGGPEEPRFWGHIKAIRRQSREVRIEWSGLQNVDGRRGLALVYASACGYATIPSYGRKGVRRSNGVPSTIASRFAT